LEGREVTTIEGMARGREPHPLQVAFAELGAAQCGYCTPAMLLTAKALLDREPRPSREMIKQALSGVLCRCTGYLKIFEAVELAHAMSIQEALAAQGEPIHGSSNVHKAVALEFGDTDAAMRVAEYVREDTVFFEGNTHLPMEQHAAVAQYAADGKLTLWTSSQTPHYVHRALGKVLELPMSRIRVIATPNGGGFGGKSDIFSHE